MTFEPDGELDLIVAESLRDRAAHATVHGRGMGDVRRRVRRRRQRQMAIGLVPAVAGVGWAVTRPMTHTPLNPSGEAGPCGETATTWLGSAPATSFPPSTTTWASDVTATTMTFDANGNVVDPNGNPLGTTTTAIVGPLTTDSDGNAVDANGNVITVPFVTDSAGNPVLVGTTWADATTTTVPADFPVLFVNASHTRATTEAALFVYPGIRTATATSTVAESVVLTSGPTDFAATIARDLGIIDSATGAPVVRAGLDSSLLPAGTDLSGITVIVILGDDVAVGLVDMWTSSEPTMADLSTTTTICEPATVSESTTVPATTEAAVSTTPTAVVGDLTSTKVQVANCSAENGVARMMSSVLAEVGFVLADPVNGTCDPKLDASYVVYDESVAGAKDVAESLAGVLGGLPAEPGIFPIKVESGEWAEGSGVVLYLGNDLAGKTLSQIANPTTTTPHT